MEEENIQKELQKLSPLLAKMKREQRKTGFDVPPTYFKNLTDEMMERVAPPVVEQQLSWLDKLLQSVVQFVPPRWSLAVATFALLLVSVWYINLEDAPAAVAVNELTLEELEQYVAANLEEFDEATLVEYQTESPVLDLEINADLPDVWLDELEPEDLL